MRLLPGWPDHERHRTLSPSIASLFMPDPKHKGEFELGMGFNTMPFDIPAIRLENPPAPAHVRIGWFRSVYNLPHAWAIQSFAHEMAVAAGKDHRDYVLDLLGPARKIHNLTVGDGWNYGEDPDLNPVDIGWMRRVIERATAEAGWVSPACRRLRRHYATPSMRPPGNASVAFLSATS